MLATGREVASAAATLSEAMKEQRKLAEDGRSEGTAAAEEAGALRSRAEMMEFDALHLLSAAERGRDRVGRASETLVSLGGEVSTTAATVHELRELSDGIGEFAQRIGHIARRTRVLALNAAIEAAHAGEHREGFAAVADQVRELAGEAADSARLAADVISEIRAGIEVVASAMTSGEKRVHGVEEVAGQAQSALEEIHTGVNKASEMVRATAGDSKAQSERLGALAQRLARVAEISAESASSASTTAQQVTAQIRAMESLNQTSQQLAELAERLQAGIAKFSVMKPGQVTQEHVVPGTR
jgi:methyl-accepting chemotaxis protein